MSTKQVNYFGSCDCSRHYELIRAQSNFHETVSKGINPTLLRQYKKIIVAKHCSINIFKYHQLIYPFTAILKRKQVLITICK